jgi:hypothetical protein
MLFAAQLPSKPLRAAQNNVTLVGANSDAPRALIFTVPIKRKFTLLGVGTDQSSATVDLIAFHIIGTQSVQLVDRQCNTLPVDEKTVPQYEVFSEGESMTLGIRNRTGAGITPDLYVFYTDEPA